MSARDLQALAVLLGLASLAGCGGDDTTKDVTDTDAVTGDDDDDDDNRDSAGGGGFFDIATVYFQSQFTYDSATYSLVELASPYGPLPGTIDIQLGTSEWEAVGLDPNRDDLYCIVSLVLDDSAIPTWVAADGYWYGTEFTAGAAGVLTNCDEYDIDPAMGDIAAAIGGYETWGVGIGDPSADVAEFIGGQAAEEQVYYFGGVLKNPWFGQDHQNILSFSYAIDPVTLEPVVDGSGYLQPLENTAVNLGSNIASGWYQAVDLNYWILY